MDVQKSLYRSVCRATRRIDSDSLIKALIVARPQRLWDRNKGKNILLKDDEINRLIWKFNQGEFYKPSENTVTSIVREEFRRDDGDLNVAFAALRRLSDAIYMSEALQKQELSSTASSPVLANKSSLTINQEFKSGSVLLTHPISCLSQEAFHRSVIALSTSTDPNEDHVFGLILNKPQNLTIEKILLPRWHKHFDHFLQNQIYIGGVVHGPLAVLHQFADAPEPYQLSLSTDEKTYFFSFLKDEEDIQFFSQKVDEQAVKPEELMFFTKYSCWADEQLRIELERNVWFPVEGKDIVHECSKQEVGKDFTDEQLSEFSNSMWQDYVSRLGPAYETLAEFPSLVKGEFEQRLAQFLDGHYHSIEELMEEP